MSATIRITANSGAVSLCFTSIKRASEIRFLLDEWMLLARCALSLIGEVVEWASAKVLEPQLGVLLHSICAYLNKPQFSLYEYVSG